MNNPMEVFEGDDVDPLLLLREKKKEIVQCTSQTRRWRVVFYFNDSCQHWLNSWFSDLTVTALSWSGSWLSSWFSDITVTALSRSGSWLSSCFSDTVVTALSWSGSGLLAMENHFIEIVRLSEFEYGSNKKTESDCYSFNSYTSITHFASDSDIKLN